MVGRRSKMRLYYVYGCDKIYNGMYGMSESGIFLCDNHEEAIEWGQELAYRVMDSYSDITDSLENRVLEICESNRINYKDDGLEVQEIRSEVYEENAYYEVDLLNEALLPSDDVDALEDLLYELGDVEFRKRYFLRSIV
jgi:hypothetical protein